MICLHKRFESLVDYRHSNSILSADWFLVILRYLHLENQVSTCYNPLNWNGWSLGTLSLSPAKQAHCPWIMTPIRVRGNSFPRALFSFLFCFSPGSPLDLEHFWTFGEKDLTRARLSKSSDKEAVLKRMITWYLREKAFNSKNWCEKLN